MLGAPRPGTAGWVCWSRPSPREDRLRRGTGYRFYTLGADFSVYRAEHRRVDADSEGPPNGFLNPRAGVAPREVFGGEGYGSHRFAAVVHTTDARPDSDADGRRIILDHLR
jgi:hypothetical protein